MGGEITAIDASQINIEIAKIHAQKSKLPINYLATTAENLANENKKFDVILALEVIEHVSDIELFLKSCSNLAKPNGIIFMHDIAGAWYPSLQKYMEYINNHSIPHYLFEKNSRADEICQRGWLMIINKK
jgi:ubiquinone biosynthesis O-methyltransferase